MIRFLIIGLLRDRSRSLFPVLMVTAGVFLTVFLYCWMQGAMGDIVSANAKFDTGHVKIMTRAYERHADQMPNDLAILKVNQLLNQLHDFNPKMIWTPRIRFGGLLDVPDNNGETRTQGPVIGLGVNLLGQKTPEVAILNLNRAVIEGRLPRYTDEILISAEFARNLGVKVGDKVTLLGSTMNGAMAIHNFIVAGTVNFGITAMDKGMIIADIQDIQTALDMPDGASEIVGYTADMVYVNNQMEHLSKIFNQQYSRQDDEFSPIMLSLSQQNGLGEYLQLVITFGNIIVIVFMLVMSLVLWNAGLMNGLRRYGEIGLRIALGEGKGTIYRRLIFEAIIIGLIGSIIGTAIGVSLSYYMQYTGIDFSSVLKKSNILISDIIRARVTWVSYLIGFIPGVIASMLGAIFAGIGVYQRQTAQLFKELEI